MATRFLWFVMLDQGSTLVTAEISALAGAPAGRIILDCNGPGCPQQMLVATEACQCAVEVLAYAVPPQYRVAVFGFAALADLEAFRAAVIGQLVQRADYRADLILKQDCGVLS